MVGHDRRRKDGLRLLMRIVAVLDQQLPDGGGFNQALTSISQLAALAPDLIELVTVTTHRNNLPILDQCGIAATCVEPALADRILPSIAGSLVWQSWQRSLRYVGPFERRLVELGADLVYFTSPSALALALQRLNYVMTIWDLCHLDFPEFPEVREFGEFHRREHLFRGALRQAIGVVVDSTALADRTEARYGVDRARLVTMPFSPTRMVMPENESEVDVCLKYGLEAGYFFYPAQGWPHKNHLRLIEAMRIAADRWPELPPLVLCGSDKGNGPVIRARAEALGIAKRIVHLGFVPQGDMAALYRAAGAIVMPTYFGPTNLPPLEAWTTGRPLIYSAHLAAQAGNAALLIDPDSTESIGAALIEVRQTETALGLVARGYDRLRAIENERRLGEDQLRRLLSTFACRVATWR